MRYVTRGPAEFQVVKTHGGLTDFQGAQLAEFAAMVQNGSVAPPLVFHTTNGNITTKGVQKFFARYGFPILMTVDTSELGQGGVEAVRDRYEHALGLNKERSAILYAWLHVWDVLRVCCGAQLSKYWRAHLLGEEDDTQGHFGAEEGPVSLCSRVDLSELEERLMSTRLYRKMHESVPALGTVSDVDGQLTGSYCKACERRIVQFGLQHNDKCDLTVNQMCKLPERQDNDLCKK